MVSKDSQFFLQNKCLLSLKLLEQDFALVYIDDILLLSDSKEHMFQLIEQLHVISTKNNLKLAPENSFFMLLKVKFLGHEIGYKIFNQFTQKLQLFKKFLLLLAKLL